MSRSTGAALAALGVLALPFALPHAALADIAVNATGSSSAQNCAGGAAAVNGDNNQVVFSGACSSLRVNGAGNVVRIDLVPGGQVAISGVSNRVLYQPMVPAPLVTAQGAGNVVSSDTPDQMVAVRPAPLAPAAPVQVIVPAVAPAATLVLDGDMQNRDIACGGQNVVIRGSNGRFVLRGGCRSITVQGRANAIQAELVPGAHVDIGGDAVTLNYTLTADGPPPVVQVAPGLQPAQVTQVTHTASPTVVTTQ